MESEKYLSIGVFNAFKSYKGSGDSTLGNNGDRLEFQHI